MCEYSSNCQQNHNIENHCYYCHGHKSNTCWYHCLKWKSIWRYHKGMFPQAKPHNNVNCIHISKNAYSLLQEYNTNCNNCNTITIHYRSRDDDGDGVLIWKCIICEKN